MPFIWQLPVWNIQFQAPSCCLYIAISWRQYQKAPQEWDKRQGGYHIQVGNKCPPGLRYMIWVLACVWAVYQMASARASVSEICYRFKLPNKRYQISFTPNKHQTKRIHSTSGRATSITWKPAEVDEGGDTAGAWKRWVAARSPSCRKCWTSCGCSDVHKTGAARQVVVLPPKMPCRNTTETTHENGI